MIETTERLYLYAVVHLGRQYEIPKVYAWQDQKNTLSAYGKWHVNGESTKLSGLGLPVNN